jgi:hypothetical protein
MTLSEIGSDLSHGHGAETAVKTKRLAVHAKESTYLACLDKPMIFSAAPMLKCLVTKCQSFSRQNNLFHVST